MAPLATAINVDRVDMKFAAIVVLEGHFLQGLYLGRQELRCDNIGVQDGQEDAQIDERTSSFVAFGTTLQKAIHLFGMKDTDPESLFFHLVHIRKSHPQIQKTSSCMLPMARASTPSILPR